MINELHQLSLAMQKAELETESWHRKYGEIPNISEKTPCLRVVIENKKVVFIESISPEKKNNIRKYGSNQGSFPHMNLASLFLLQEEDQIKKINQIKKNIEKDISIEEIKELCVNNNWKSERFAKKYKNCFETVTCELEKYLRQDNFSPLSKLIEEAKQFNDPFIFHSALYQRALKMIEAKKNINVALNLLFYINERKENDLQKEVVSDFGRLSLLLDSIEIEKQGFSSTGMNFTYGLNQALLSADKRIQSASSEAETDAFGKMFTTISDPMPTIKLAAGFNLSLRTMFHGQPNQYRYGKIENDTYPISLEKRNEIKDALEYLSSKKMQNKTWIISGKDDKNKPDEVLFIYPNRFPDEIPGFVGVFASIDNNETKQFDFQAQSEAFAEYITKTKEYDPEEYPDNIQIFIIKKIDKARSKVIYSHISSPNEIIQRSDLWQKATKNVPNFYTGINRIPFPIEIAEIMNHIWKQNGDLSSDKFKYIKSYHGLEMLFGLAKSELIFDLHILLRNSQKLAVYAGQFFNTKDHPDDKKIVKEIKSNIVLMGMFLFWLDQRKEKYMNEYPYLLGQLLKVSDNLHELYCYKVRDGNIPPQLVGGSMYMSASEFPKQAISQLSQRVMPYLNWARTHQNDKIEKNEDSDPRYFEPTAGYYLNQYRKISDKLLMVMSETTRFTDTEKACLFLGYLASFPKSQKDDGSEKENEE